MSLFRIILYSILFYLLYKAVKNVFNFLFTPRNEVKGEAKKRVKTFDSEDIEDIDYEEVKRKDE